MAITSGRRVVAGRAANPPPERSGGPGRRQHRPWTAGALVAVVAVLGVTVAASTARGRPSPAGPARNSPTAHVETAGLPTLGASRAIEVNNPALNDIGDPYVLPIAGGVGGNPGPGYAVYWTTDWTANVPTALSTDLVHWRRVADALPTLPSWALQVRPPRSWSAPAGVSTMTWGPTVHRVAGGFVLYYSTEAAATRQECIGAGFSTSPIGPFVDPSSAPLVCQSALGGDIDPSVVVPTPGHLALVWKNDGNASGAPVSIWEEGLTNDGRATTGSPVRLIGADQAWEHHIIEGPAMLADSRGGWWLFYSGGTWQSNTYDTGVSSCVSMAGPCRSRAKAPLLASVATAVSPGGFDTFVDHRGRLWAAYSAFPSRPANAEAAMASPRVLELAPVLSH